MSSGATVLLTGASGVVGRAIAQELSDERVIGLVHSDPEAPELDEVVHGDLAAPRLGLDRATWDRIAAETTAIIHSGALTTWGQPYERYDAINIQGTRGVIELARRSGAPVHLVSTSFVHALELAPEQVAADNVVLPYIRSKLESERLLRESGVAWTIFRPTNLIGHSQTGASTRPQIVQALSDWIGRGKASYLPAHPGNRVDIVPLDILAITVAEAVRQEPLGDLFWVTYGDEAMTVEETMSVLVEHARARGKELTLAPLVDPREPLPVPLADLPALSRTFVKVMIDVSEVTHAAGGVLPSSMDTLRARFGVPTVSDVESYRLSLAYWAAQRGEALASVKEPV